jgi:putative DNA primase/helicase
VTVGVDDAGEAITSCVVLPDDSSKAVKQVKLPQGEHQAAALKTLGELFKTSKQFNKPGAIPGRPCLDMEAAVIAIADSLTCKPKRKNERAREALTRLIGRGLFATHGGWIWRCD